MLFALAAQAIAAEIDARKSADALILAEQGRWYTAVIRPLLALPIIIYLWKVIVWDKVLAWGPPQPQRTRRRARHAVLMQAKGVRWAIVAVAGVVGFVTGISQWLMAKA